ncbi:hypothetical protein IMCC3088_2207 [Aequoribacter fuscus]|uniref:Uncharacterized protein n=1 Tax=Aequoribacter fuscus TaxID=2518989 RepID=F3L3L5_9GAMM|nr:hypothetical protein IMCC3088_2207 [Aequoribacter fuscus]
METYEGFSFDLGIVLYVLASNLNYRDDILGLTVIAAVF